MNRVLAAIPARYHSSRFPRKLLHLIGDTCILKLVLNKVQESKSITDIIVVTDHDDLEREANETGVSVIRSTGKPICGTDRILQADISFTDYDLIINVQADQPFLQPQIIDLLVAGHLSRPEINIASVRSRVECEDPSESVVKVGIDAQGLASDFYRHNPLDQKAYYHHGLYSFRPNIISRLQSLQPTVRESLLNLEQLRWLENQIGILMIPVPFIPRSVDIPEDVI